ncbi:MAG TPA: hypothetical protein VIN56_06165, partial [Candidatus Dormibacteraeota bacterium]
MPLQVPVLTLEEWKARVPRRRFSLPELPEPVLRRLGDAVGREVADAEDGVDEIIRQVRDEGDAAVRRLTMAFDGSAPDPVE